MVAYSFKAQFREPILAGTKRQTIRADRKRHARLGEALQLYTGMRTRQCKLIGRATCNALVPVTLGLSAGWIDTPAGQMRDPPSLDLFAITDGFADWAYMIAFWRRKHPDMAVFSSILIRWEGLST